MIVIVIMGVVYTLVITKLQTVTPKTEKLSLETMKATMAKIAKKSYATVELWCFDSCESCALFVAGKKLRDVEPFVDREVEVYRYDYLRGLIPVDPDPFFDKNDLQKDVCFHFSVDSQGVSDQVFVVSKEKAYDYTDYFNGVGVYDSVEKIVETKEKIIEEVK